MISIENIIEILKVKNKESIPQILRAYDLAELAHDGVYRESGEPYISHPLHVCKNLLDMEIYDADTLSAALLHDVLEECKIDPHEIEKEFGTRVMNLVLSETVKFFPCGYTVLHAF